MIYIYIYTYIHTYGRSKLLDHGAHEADVDVLQAREGVEHVHLNDDNNKDNDNKTNNSINSTTTTNNNNNKNTIIIFIIRILILIIILVLIILRCFLCVFNVVAEATANNNQDQALVRDRHLYTTTNKCLQCLIKIMYTVF